MYSICSKQYWLKFVLVTLLYTSIEAQKLHMLEHNDLYKVSELRRDILKYDTCCKTIVIKTCKKILKYLPVNTAVYFQYQVVLVKKIQYIQIKLRINSYNQWCQLMREICDCSTTANENREQNFFKNLS